MTDTSKPLDGVTVLELGQLLAGPFTGCILGYFGAEVIKVEPPQTGDPIRGWRLVDNGTSWWWYSLGRNKKCVTANLNSERGRELVKELAADSDVLIENFRPGRMEKWGLGPEDLKRVNPNLIYTRVSGYGQNGPNSHLPGFASVCEGYGGFRYVNGFPDRPPVRPNLSMGDTLAAIHAALGILLAYIHRSKGNNGQVVDVSIFESVFNIMEGVVPEYSGAGAIREPSGSTLTGIVPTNTYLCKDDKHIIIGGNGDSIFKRLMNAIGRDDLANDPRLEHNPGRVRHEAELDDAILDWTRQHDAAEAIELLAEASVPAGPIYSVADMMEDEHYRARGLFEEVDVNGRPLAIPAIMPQLNDTPGATEWPGMPVGTHNDEIYGGRLGLSTDELQALREQEVI
jgi:crotonobetainyl-CoA:carnitine CoA-transferase CaiB-like acyl-CoA transferase